MTTLGHTCYHVVVSPRGTNIRYANLYKHVTNQHSSHISVLLIYDLIVRRLLIGRNHNIHIRAFVKMAAAVRLAESIFEIWKIFSNINGPVIWQVPILQWNIITNLIDQFVLRFGLWLSCRSRSRWATSGITNRKWRPSNKKFTDWQFKVRN